MARRPALKLTAEWERQCVERWTEKELGKLASWPDSRLRQLVECVEAGYHDCRDGSVPDPAAPGLADVFELGIIEQALSRRGWPPLRLGAPGGLHGDLQRRLRGER